MIEVTTRVTAVTEFTADDLNAALAVVKFADRLKRSTRPSGERLSARQLRKARKLVGQAAAILARHSVVVKGVL